MGNYGCLEREHNDIDFDAWCLLDHMGCNQLRQFNRIKKDLILK